MVFIRIATILFVSLLSAGCFRPIVFEGVSMEPNFHDGDRILMAESIDDLKRLDVIYFRYPKDETKAYMKRIVGLPGEKVEVKNGVVFVNDEEIDETAYVDPNRNNSSASFPPRIIAPDNYYVLGDNRDNSSDSRYWGTVSRSQILGKYYFRYSTKNN